MAHDELELFAALESALERLSVRISRATSVREAVRVLPQPNPPRTVFTATNLPDGTSADLVRLVAAASLAVNVIVVSRLDDCGLYLDAIEGGAFDFLAPPFTADYTSHVLHCTMSNALTRAKAQSRGS